MVHHKPFGDVGYPPLFFVGDISGGFVLLAVGVLTGVDQSICILVVT